MSQITDASYRHKKLANIIISRTGSFVNGNIHFYYFLNTAPIKGLINIPYINDIPHVQLQYIGRCKNDIEKSLNKYKAMAKSVDAFFGLNETFCESVKRFYEIDVPYGYFASFPLWFKSPSLKRDEIVYIDNSATMPFGFKEHIAFLDKIRKTTGIKTLFASKKFSRNAVIIRNKNKFSVDIKSHVEYDFASKYGILMNTNNFNQVHEALSRKMFIYLMCNMRVLIHDSFIESIKFVRCNDVNPFIYKDDNDFANLCNYDFCKTNIDPRNFCLEERVKNLDSQLIQLAKITRKC